MNKLTLFFDGKCSVCVAEVDVYRKLDSQNKLAYVSFINNRSEVFVIHPFLKTKTIKLPRFDGIASSPAWPVSRDPKQPSSPSTETPQA